MSDDSGTDDATCWECGKNFRSLQCLMLHYQNHDVEATCHICQVTFRRKTSLFTHMKNAHFTDHNYHKTCSVEFDDKGEGNELKETDTKVISSTMEKTTGPLSPEDLYKTVAEDHSYCCTVGNLQAGITQVVANSSSDVLLASPPVISTETYSESSEFNLQGRNQSLIGFEVGHNEVEIPFQAPSYMSENNDDSLCDINERIPYANEHQEEESNDDQEAMSVADSDFDSDGIPFDTNSDSSPFCKKNKPLTTFEEGEIEMEICHEMSDQSEDTDDTLSFQDGDVDEVYGGEESPNANMDQEMDVEEDSDEDQDTANDGDLDCDQDSSSSSEICTDSSKPANNLGGTYSRLMSTCAYCGRGPFRNVKVHLLHCSKRTELHCHTCKRIFSTEKSMLEHKVRLYFCNCCSRFFPHQHAYDMHRCFKGTQLTTPCVVYCCTAIPPIEHGANMGTQWGGAKTDVGHLDSKSPALEIGHVEMEVPYDVRSDKSDDDTSVSSLDKEVDGAQGDETGSDTDGNQEDAEQLTDQDSDYNPHKESDSNSDSNSSCETSSLSSDNECSVTTSRKNKSMCTLCGFGPFKNLGVHMRYCSGKGGLQCSVCKKSFTSEKELNQHKIQLYFCKCCVRPFSSWTSYRAHDCFSKEELKPPLIVNSCSVSPLNQCSPGNAPKRSISFSIVPLGVRHVSQSPIGSMPIAIQSPPLFPSPSAPQSSSVPVAPHPAPVNGPRCVVLKELPNTLAIQQNSTKVTLPQHIENNKRILSSQALMNVVQVVIQNQAPLNTPQPTHPAQVRPSVPMLLQAPSSAIPQGTSCSLGQGLCQQPGLPPTTGNAPKSTPNNTIVSVASNYSFSNPPLTIVAMFKNDSRELAMKKRMSTSWRSKSTYPCRQCGATSRQPSFLIIHRYLHRGRHSYRCYCGRTFQHQLYLLRHCVQHAEATSYICVSCGETFEGAKVFAKHTKWFSKRSRSSRSKWRNTVGKGCNVPFSCACGQIFLRPSAYIWHQLKNAPKAKRRKKPSK